MIPASEMQFADDLAFVAYRAPVAPLASGGPAAVPSGEAAQRAGFDFHAAMVDPRLFQRRRWRALLHRHVDRLGVPHHLAQPGGSSALQTAVAGWLAANNGLCVSPG